MNKKQQTINALWGISNALDRQTEGTRDNSIYEQKQENERLQKELAVRDRVDISKKEYLELLETIKKLKERNNELTIFQNRIINPLLINGIVTQNQIQQIENNKAKVQVKVFENYSDPLAINVGIMYIVDKEF